MKALKKNSYSYWKVKNKNPFNLQPTQHLTYNLITFFPFSATNHIEPPVNRFAAGRRKSVFAEQYDPEEDNDDEEANKVIFPKTDEQRSRLCDSVKNILLFRALDPEQVC